MKNHFSCLNKWMREERNHMYGFFSALKWPNDQRQVLSENVSLPSSNIFTCPFVRYLIGYWTGQALKFILNTATLSYVPPLVKQFANIQFCGQRMFYNSDSATGAQQGSDARPNSLKCHRWSLCRGTTLQHTRRNQHIVGVMQFRFVWH